MSGIDTAERLSDAPFGVATLAGLAAIPPIALLHWASAPNSAYGVPVFLAGALVGYVYGERADRSRRAGLGCGLAAALPIAAWLSVSLPYEAWAASTEVRTIAALTVVAVVLNVGFYALAGTIGGIVGGSLARRVGQRGHGGRANSS